MIKNLRITKFKSKSQIQKREIETELSALIGLPNRAREICRGSYNKSTPRNRQKGGYTTCYIHDYEKYNMVDNSVNFDEDESYKTVDYDVNSEEENDDNEFTNNQYTINKTC